MTAEKLSNIKTITLTDESITNPLTLTSAQFVNTNVIAALKLLVTSPIQYVTNSTHSLPGKLQLIPNLVGVNLSIVESTPSFDTFLVGSSKDTYSVTVDYSNTIMPTVQVKASGSKPTDTAINNLYGVNRVYLTDVGGYAFDLYAPSPFSLSPTKVAATNADKQGLNVPLGLAGYATVIMGAAFGKFPVLNSSYPVVEVVATGANNIAKDSNNITINKPSFGTIWWAIQSLLITQTPR